MQEFILYKLIDNTDRFKTKKIKRMKIFRYFHFLFLFIFTQCFPVPKVAGQFTEQEFDQMAERMATGDVNDMSVEELLEQQGEIYLLDAREKKEYQISHIAGAKWVGYDNFKMKRIKDLPKDAKIVTYCSVGYRSERIGEKLQKAGFTNVYNLKGSIFKWINEGHPVVDEKNEPTTKVHGYDKKWGKWVKKGEVVF